MLHPVRKNKSITLVIAVYNAVRYLEYILTSLRGQTADDFEVIVADDGRFESFLKKNILKPMPG